MTAEDEATMRQGYEEYQKIEKEIEQLEASFADPSFYSRSPADAVAANSRLESARNELDAAETRWLELSERNQ